MRYLPTSDAWSAVPQATKVMRGGAVEPRQDGQRGILERLPLLDLVLEQVHDHLGVGLRREDVAGRDQRRLQLQEVLDDPVVDDRSGLRAIDVRMRVLLGRASVRRPARVSDAGGAGGRMRRDDRGEVVELA